MIEINNLTNFNIDKKLFTGVAKKVLTGENKGTTTAKRGPVCGKNISIAFVAKSEMQKLNKKFRGIDKPTDVLAFGENLKSEYRNPKFFDLGEVVICPEVVEEKKETIEEVLVHGILHLCGYDHEKSEKEAEEMESQEKKYLSK